MTLLLLIATVQLLLVIAQHRVDSVQAVAASGQPDISAETKTEAAALSHRLQRAAALSHASMANTRAQTPTTSTAAALPSEGGVAGSGALTPVEIELPRPESQPASGSP